MAAADYRLMTEATGQRIAAALEALSGTGAAAAAARTNLDVYSKGETDTAIAQSTAKVVRHTVSTTTNSNGVIFTDIPISTKAWGFATHIYPCIIGYYQDKWFLLVTESANGDVVPHVNASITYVYYTLEYGA